MFRWQARIEPEPDRYGVDWAITDRGADHDDGGGADSDSTPFGGFNLATHVGDHPDRVEAHRAQLARELGLSQDRLRFMNQVHGARVVTVSAADDDDAGTAPTGDAMITAEPDLALVVLVADCTPILLADRTAGVAAAVHAGRPGLMAGVVDAAIAALQRRGATALEAVVGPSVCSRCYEVPPPMAAEVSSAHPTAAGVSWQGTPALDVAAAAVARLAAADIPLTWLPGCSRESADLYSYRRDGTTGRYAGVVRLRAPLGHPQSRHWPANQVSNGTVNDAARPGGSP